MSRAPQSAIRSWGVKKDGRIIEAFEKHRQARHAAKRLGGEVVQVNAFEMPLGDGFHAPLSEKIRWDPKA
jgi:hypothetical protein